MAQTKKDALATGAEEVYPLAVMDPNNRIDLGEIAKELGGDPSSLMGLLFTKVKMPSGGGLAFEVENADDPNDPEIEKILEGVIVAHHPARVFWIKSMEEGGGNNAPDCSSVDGQIGRGVRWENDSTAEGHPCHECPLSEFGSASNGGQACKERHNLYLMREGDLIPTLVSLPPTSVKAWRSFAFKSILSKKMKTSGVVVRIRLEKATSSDNVEYSKTTFTKVATLPADQADYLAGYGADIAGLVAANAAAVIAATANVSTPVGAKAPEEAF